MSVQAMSWVLEHSESRLGPRLVLLSIANHARADGTGAWPAIATIAREARLSEREVQYAVRKLVAGGELEVQSGFGPKGTNLYSLPRMGGAKCCSGGCKILQKHVGFCTRTVLNRKRAIHGFAAIKRRRPEFYLRSS